MLKIYENQFLYVRKTCWEGTCSCIYILDGIPAQLKPCRVASLILCKDFISNEDEFVMTGVCRGFKIIDPNVSLSYKLGNYSSILCDEMSAQMSKNVHNELVEGKISSL